MKMKSDTMSKINTYEKAVKTVWYIVLGAGLIMLIISIIYTVLYMLGDITLPNKALGIEFTAPGLKMKVDSDLLGDFFIPTQLSMVINAVLIWVLLFYSVSQFLKIIKAIKDNGTPFIDGTVKRIKFIAYSFFLYSISAFIINIILQLLYINDSLIAGNSGIRLQINTELPFWSILCGIFILVIAATFNYGLELQQDNDSIL